MRLGNYEVIRQEGGFHSVRDTRSGEVMHSVNDPSVESRALYIDQIDLESALADSDQQPFVIWDVGLGAGTNAMSAITESEAIRARNPHARRTLRIISFENDLDSFRLAMKNQSLFPHMRHGAPEHFLNDGQWNSSDGLIRWDLLEGDFTSLLEHADIPDCIFYDMYSAAANERLWSTEVFTRVFNRCPTKKTRLITYSSSTQIRSALLAAGFFVGYGAGSGPRADTTIAFNSREAIDPRITLLGDEWLSRWNRSSARTAKSISDTERADIENRVRSHPQFYSR